MPNDTTLPVEEYPDTFQYINAHVNGALNQNCAILYADREIVVDAVTFTRIDGGVGATTVDVGYGTSLTATTGLDEIVDGAAIPANNATTVLTVTSEGGANIVPVGQTLVGRVGIATVEGYFTVRFRTRRK